MKKLANASLKFILTMAVFLVYGCDKEVDLEFRYEQTFCADQWDNAATNTMEMWTQERFFNEFMEAEEILFSNYELNLENTPEDCFACSCLTGYVFYITASSDFENELKSLGFSLNE